jgi:hypothetical protein
VSTYTLRRRRRLGDSSPEDIRESQSFDDAGTGDLYDAPYTIDPTTGMVTIDINAAASGTSVSFPWWILLVLAGVVLIFADA